MKKHVQLLAVGFAVATIGSSALAGEYQVTTADLTGAQVDASANLSSSTKGYVAKYDPPKATPFAAPAFRTVTTTLHFNWVGTGEDALNPPPVINVKQNFTVDRHLKVSASSSNGAISSAGTEAYPPSIQDGLLSYYYYPTWSEQYDPPIASFDYDQGNRAGLLTDQITTLVGAKGGVYVNVLDQGQSGSSSGSISVKTTGLTFTPVDGGG